MIFVKNHNSTNLMFLIKQIICVIIISGLMLTSFGYCRHTHEHWINIVEDCGHHSHIVQNELDDHSHPGDEDNNHDEAHSQCDFRFFCHGGVVGVLNSFIFQFPHSWNRFFPPDMPFNEFGLIQFIDHPPVYLS